MESIGIVIIVLLAIQLLQHDARIWQVVKELRKLNKNFAEQGPKQVGSGPEER